LLKTELTFFKRKRILENFHEEDKFKSMLMVMMIQD